MSNVADILKNVLPEKVLAPGREEYATSNGSYFTAFENEIRPAYIVQPASVQDVSKFVQELHPLLVTGDLLLAVRGGGHTPFEGSANIKDGVTIDMRGLKGVTLSEDKSIVTIGVGEDWTSVYRELEKHGLTTAGGRVGRVGVTGLVLGGNSFSFRHPFFHHRLIDRLQVVSPSTPLVADSPAILSWTGKWFSRPAKLCTLQPKKTRISGPL